jgi:D-hexose-6-phosphate mutarotase
MSQNSKSKAKSGVRRISETTKKTVAESDECVTSTDVLYERSVTVENSTR